MSELNKNPLVSIITATYNMGNYVSMAVDSVLAQTYDNVECIVVDDGSQDDTREVMSAYSSDSRVKFIAQPQNCGQTVTKNRGLQESSGQIIGFLDADNIWKRDKLEKQLPFLDRDNKYGVVYSDLELINGKGEVLDKIKRTYFEGHITAELLKHNFVNFNSALVRRECIEEMGPFDENFSMGIDWELWLRISTRYHFKFLDEATYYYRIWENQMSHNKLKRLNNAKNILEKFNKNYSDTVTPAEMKAAWAKLYLDFARVYQQNKQLREAKQSMWQVITMQPYSFETWKSLIRLSINK
jgi:glycosyltransferase involved in cell wall biosynthesis